MNLIIALTKSFRDIFFGLFEPRATPCNKFRGAFHLRSEGIDIQLASCEPRKYRFYLGDSLTVTFRLFFHVIFV